MDDLYADLQVKRGELNQAVKLLRKTGEKYAWAEREYQVLKAQECLRLRDDGMAVGMIENICRGLPNVAEARMKRDIAEANYKANQEAINVYKLEARLIEAQIEREWGQAKE